MNTSPDIKISIMAPMWRRPEIFKHFAEGILALDYPIEVLCVGSERHLSKSLAESFGFHYAEYSNTSLINKLNEGCKVLKHLKPDMVIMLGSDDLINQPLLDAYIKAFKEGYDYIYLTDAYFYDINQKRSLYWAGYDKDVNRGHALGAGRVLSKRLLDNMGWKVWDNGFDRITDSGMDTRLAVAGPYKKLELRCENSDYLILDLKSEQNMTPFERWPNSEYISSDIIKEKLNEKVWKRFL